MATAPAMDPTQDPTAGDDDTSETQEQTSVVITDMGDGTFTVKVQESDQDEAPDDQDGPQTADNIDDALEIARQMLQAESSEESDEGEPSSGDEPMPADKAKSYWNQLATSRAKTKAAG